MLINLDWKLVALITVILIAISSILLANPAPVESSKYGRKDAMTKIVYGSMLATMAIVVKFSFEILPLPDLVKRLEIFVIFIILAGILLGPLYGGIVGFVTDLVYLFTFGGTFGLFTLAHVAVGLVPGLLFLVFKYNIKTSIVTIILSVLAYFTLTTVALYYVGFPTNVVTVTWRLLRTLLVLPIQIYIIHLLVADRRFSNFSVYRQFYDRQNLEY